MSEKSFVHVLSEKNTLVLSGAFYRSHSRSSFLVDSPSIRPTQEPYVKAEYNSQIPISPELSAPLCHRTPQAGCWSSLLYTQTPSISSQLDTMYDEDEEHQVVLLPCDEVGYCKHAVDLAPSASPHATDSYAVSPIRNRNFTNSSRTESPVPLEHVERAKDDNMVRDQPSRYVDYLSHDWEEEDIWSSWKHIVSKRKIYGDATRLENASWRTWTKSQYRLRTVRPESLNWLKDCDVTWLYGPLQTSSDNLSIPPTSPVGIRISELHSLLDKRPILKKRSLLEIMLQESLSASLREQSPAMNERRHIHFNDKVEQFAAVDVEDSDDDEDGIESYAIDDDDDDDGDDGDDSSDDGLLMMKRSSKPTVLNQSNRNSSQASFSAESRTIAALPSTTLKYREDAPELTEPATKMLLESQDENAGLSGNPFAKHNDRISVARDRTQLNALWERNGGEARGHLHCPPCGTFMCEEGDDDVARSLFDRVLDGMNTAKDIAYVIWNVGWR